MKPVWLSCLVRGVDRLEQAGPGFRCILCHGLQQHTGGGQAGLLQVGPWRDGESEACRGSIDREDDDAMRTGERAGITPGGRQVPGDRGRGTPPGSKNADISRPV